MAKEKKAPKVIKEEKPVVSVERAPSDDEQVASNEDMPISLLLVNANVPIERQEELLLAMDNLVLRAGLFPRRGAKKKEGYNWSYAATTAMPTNSAEILLRVKKLLDSSRIPNSSIDVHGIPSKEAKNYIDL